MNMFQLKIISFEMLPSTIIRLNLEGKNLWEWNLLKIISIIVQLDFQNHLLSMKMALTTRMSKNYIKMPSIIIETWTFKKICWD